MVDKDYRDVSYFAYKIDNAAKERINIKEGRNILEGKYKVLSLEDNQNNGMQAVAVAPVNARGEVDTSKIIIAYAGTRVGDRRDIDTDVQQVLLGRKENLVTDIAKGKRPTRTRNQLQTAKEFADEILKKYPSSLISVTGHSLGGYLAVFIAAKNGWAATVFNAPDASNALSEKEI